MRYCFLGGGLGVFFFVFFSLFFFGGGVVVVCLLDCLFGFKEF